MASPGTSAGQQPSGLNGDEDLVARQKRAAAEVAADMVRGGMRVGLGTGSTVAHLLDALAERELPGVRFVATSPASERAARALGLTVEAFAGTDELDLVIDGADQIDPDGWLIKGGGGAHTREKIVAAAGRCFVVIASAEKAVQRLTPPVPLELMEFGVQSTLAALAPARLRARPPEGIPDTAVEQRADPHPAGRPADRVWRSPDGGLIADYFGAVGDPRELSARLSATPGVVEHGLFAPETVSVILIAHENGVERRLGAKPDA
jgi:ribose 5-phosphate isomerase A